jgi:hypothetical protein
MRRYVRKKKKINKIAKKKKCKTFPTAINWVDGLRASPLCGLTAAVERHPLLANKTLKPL